MSSCRSAASPSRTRSQVARSFTQCLACRSISLGRPLGLWANRAAVSPPAKHPVPAHAEGWLHHFRRQRASIASSVGVRKMRTNMQLIFQDPLSSLNPHRTVAVWSLSRWLSGGEAEGQTATVKVRDLLDAVGLPAGTFGGRKAHKLSGGQAQRVSIARALALEPTLLVCDEPVSALDVSVQAQIVNLLEDLKARYRLTMLFISHDLSLIRLVSDRICVMYLGRFCELGQRDAVHDAPRHPYTAALLASVSHPDPTMPPTPPPLAGELPSAIRPPSGCRFHTRCPRASPVCTEVVPPFAPVAGDPDHLVACHHPLEPGEGLGGTATPAVIRGESNDERNGDDLGSTAITEES